jgi:hypothetical protein
MESFQALADAIFGPLDMHSFRKFAASFARMMGSAPNDIDVRGRWKGRRAGRVVLTFPTLTLKLPRTSAVELQSCTSFTQTWKALPPTNGYGNMLFRQ